MPSDPKRPQSRSHEDSPEDPFTESPEADAAEQRAAVGAETDDWPANAPIDSSEASEADAVEQLREAGPDEDDYR